jgi:hypothetical protein
MTVDLRATVATDLGIVVSGDISSNLISDRSGLVMTQGRLQVDGIITPARGTLVRFLVACPQTGKVTRFPKPLRVIRSVAYPLERRSEIEVGCRLTLMKDRKDQIVYGSSQYTPSWWSGLNAAQKSLAPRPIIAQQLLQFCLQKIGITLAVGSRPLLFSFLRPEIDLSSGYVQVIGDLIRSECCFGRLKPDETFEVVPINLSKGGKGSVLREGNLVSIEPITVGQEPADNYIVKYTAAERKA